MKKTLACLALLVGLSGNAWGQYQIPNSDFESWANTNEPGGGWFSFPSARTDDLNAFAQGLAISNSKANTTSITGRGGSGKAVHLISRDISFLGIGGKANGNLTTGRINMGSTTPSNSNNYNYTDRDGSNHFIITGHPDALEYWAKFTRGESGNYNARCRVILHGEIDYKDPGETDANKAAYMIAEANISASPCDEWQRFWGVLEYTGVTSTGNTYVLATFTTNPTPGGSKGDVFDIDDVKFLYYSELATCTYDGTTVNFTNGTATVDAFYDASKISYTSNGHGATIEKSFNEETQMLTITVKGEDISENTSNFHTYTIQFKQYEANLTAATYNGAAVNFTNGAASVDQFYDESKLALTVSEQATVTKSFDQATQKLTITVTSGDGKKTNTYTIQFKQYTYTMTSVTYNGTAVTADNGIYQVNEYYDKYDANKLVPVGSDEAVTFEKGAMNATTHQVTVTAKSGNYANDHNSTAYTFQFKDYSAMLEATYDGTAIIFDKNNSATVNAFYEADKLSLKPSDAATTALSMDEQTQLLTITVTSGDGKKVVPYTIQFNQYEAEIVSATYNDTPVTFTNNAATVNERYAESNLKLVLSDGATSTLSHNSTTQLLTITVTSKNNAKTNTYTIQFPTSFTYTIKGGKGHWGTFCFPGKVTSAEGIEVYRILGKDKETDPSWISLEQVTTFPLTDGMPYIYLSSTSDETIQVITDASYAPNPRTSNGLVGVYKDTEIKASDTSVPYILTGNKIQKAGSGVWCRANHAWIRMSGNRNYVPVYTGPTTGNVKYFYIANDLPTDIESIENEAQQPKQVFDLSGRRVTNPTKGGIYIVNGKKIVIR